MKIQKKMTRKQLLKEKSDKTLTKNGAYRLAELNLAVQMEQVNVENYPKIVEIIKKRQLDNTATKMDIMRLNFINKRSI